MTAPPTIVAMGGGGFSMEPDNPLLDDAILAFGRDVRGRSRPRVCFVPTASGDAEAYIQLFHDAFAGRAETSHLALFERTIDDIRAFLLDHDVIYVGGGNTANLLAVWRVHGVDRAIRAAWDAGVVLSGLSAGSLCWFEGGTTDSFGSALAVLDDGLGFLPGSHCPHYDGEPERRPHYRRLVGEGRLAAGFAADDGAALVFRGRELERVISSRPDARGYRVERAGDGPADETPLPTTYLG